MGDWYHGKLDRKTSEARLQLDGRPGCFLLRESDRKSGSFVLSYLGNAGVNHFRITHIMGSFFIGGRKFDSLLDLIEYYSSSCDLLVNERLLYPVAPPEPVASRNRLFISILPYTKLAQSDELSFQKGDLLLLENDLRDGWYWCRHVLSGDSGLVFASLVEEVSEDIDPNEIYPWFHPNISKTDAVAKLAQAGPGSYLVRPSDNSPGNYSLFYHVGPTVQRFRIVRVGDNRYVMGGRSYESLGHIITRYRIEQIVEGHVLSIPIVTTMSRTTQLSEISTLASIKSIEISNKSQDIYATLRESREASKHKQSFDLKGWLWLKKRELHKKWSRYYFVLNTKDQHLYYYEKVHQTKPKGLIDLSYSYLYIVHDSLFDKTNCFQLVEKSLPCFSNFFYLRCDENDLQYELWINSIQKLTSPNQQPIILVNKTSNGNSCSANNSSQHILSRPCSIDKSPLLSQMSDISDGIVIKQNIYLTFYEAHSIRTQQPYFVVSLNDNINICRTQVKCPPKLVFEDDSYFALEELSRDITSFKVTLYDKSGKKSRDTEVAELSFELKKFKQIEEKDEWYELVGIHPFMREVKGSWGWLRLKSKLKTDIIMAYSEYSALEDLILDTDLEVIYSLEHLCHKERTVMASALNNILEYKRVTVDFINIMIEKDVNLETDTSTLFRTSCLTTSIIECHMRVACKGLLIKLLTPSIKRLMDGRINCELNPIKLDSQSNKACENLENLLNILDELVDRIFTSVALFPVSVRRLCHCLQSSVIKRWPNESLVKTRVVGSFIFLRLICPAILNPKQFSLVNEAPTEIAARNLMLVAKCIQNLANLVECTKPDELEDSPMKSIFSSDNQSEFSVSIIHSIIQLSNKSATTPQTESWMEVVNPFILKNKARVIKFIDDLSGIEKHQNNNEFSTRDRYTSSLHSPPCQDLTIIHDLCEEHIKELDDLAISKPSLKKLVTISNILTQHKQHYFNMNL